VWQIELLGNGISPHLLSEIKEALNGINVSKPLFSYPILKDLIKSNIEALEISELAIDKEREFSRDMTFKYEK